MMKLQPPDWLAPRGYANGIATDMTVGSRLIFVGGQIGWNGQQQFESDDFAEQTRQTLQNIVDILAVGGARPEHITRMTWYVRDMDEYIAARKDLAAVYREIMGEHYPAMALVQVQRLLEPEARLEIEATAVVP